MQTPQVSNPAITTSQPAPARQADSGSSDAPFGKVLSREIAGRNASENSRPQTRETGNSAPSRQPARNDGKAADAKGAKDARQAQAQEENTETEGTAVDAALQASEDMLALVANLAQIATQSGETQDAAASTEQTLPADQATLLATVAGTTVNIPTIPVAQPVGATRTAGASVTSEAGLIGEVTLAAASPRPNHARALPDAATDSSAPQLSTAELEAKGRDLLSGVPAATVANQSSTTSVQDFKSAVKDSLAAITNVTATTMAPVQQAAVHAAQTMGDNAAERLTPRVGTPAWDQALGQKVVWMVAGEQQSASLTLNPPDLGPLQVVLNVSNSQASATFTAAQPEVRQALEAALPKLRDMLSEAGIQLGQASVNSGSPNQQGAFEQQAGSAPHGPGHGDHRNAAAEAESTRVSRVRPATVGQGMVDTFA